MTRVQRRWVVAAALTGAVVAVAMARSRAPMDVQQDIRLDTFDSGHAGWTASRGEIGTATAEAERRQGRGALVWRYEYPRDSLYLVTRTGLDRLRSASGLRVWLKSDREGAIFVRIDQSDGAAFFVVVPVGTTWQEEDLTFDRFQPASGEGRLAPGLAAALYFVDLSGNDGATGQRAVWIDDLRASMSPAPAKASAPAPPRTSSGEEGLTLAAYDASGRLRSQSDWRDLGQSGGSYLYGSNLAGAALDTTVRQASLASTPVPRLVAAGSDPVVVNVLFWPTRDAGKRWLQADNAGAGYRRAATLNVNYELARTQVARVQALLSGDVAGVDLSTVRPRMSDATAGLSAAAAAKDDRERARLADAALSAALLAGDDLLVQIARRDIPRVRQGELRVTVRDADGRPVPNAQVHFSQTSSDFLFGCAQSFGFLDGKPSRDTIGKLIAQLKAAGFNHVNMPLFWDKIEPRPGEMDLDAWDRSLGIDQFADQGFTFTAHSVMQWALPDFVKRAGKANITALATAHFQSVIRRYRARHGDRVKVWEAINEPSSNRFVGLNAQEEVELIRAIVATIRREAPGARVQINDNDWDRGQRFHTLNADTKELISSYDQFSLLNKAGVDYDVLGLQWYPGVRVIFGGGIIDFSEPLQDLLAASSIWDHMATLKKPIHLTEFAVPGMHESEWTNGYWHEPWSPAAQAEFISAFYTLAFSKPYIHEVTYWGITDHEPWARAGGLFDLKYQPKPVLEAVRALRKAWTSSGVALTDANGQVTIRGFAGSYGVRVDRDGRATSASTTITERQTRTFDLSLQRSPRSPR